MATFSSSKASRERGPLTPGQESAAAFLFYSGWAVTLLYFPSGLMHAVFGGKVYFRDILLMFHLAAVAVWLLKTGRFSEVARRSALLFVPAVFILPALFNDVYRVEAMTFIKWTAFWLDWICLGSLSLLVIKGRSTALTIFVVLTMLLLVADLGAGFYEKASGTYVFQVKGEVSAFGVRSGLDAKLASELRIKGLQRDVFSFANLMAASCVAGLLAFVNARELRLQIACVVWSGLFGLGMFNSGGRSAFFGVFAAALVAGGLLFMQETVRKYYKRIVLGWFLIALAVSATGVGRLSEAIGGSVMKGSHIGNSDSAYERDANWTGITDTIKGAPIVLVSGGPVAALLDPKVDAIYHWADNQYLWFLYHTSIIGFLAMTLFFATMLGLPPPGDRQWIKDGMVLFLLFVMGEAIARESMTFIGCMPLFVACGCLYYGAGESVSRGAPRSSSRRPRPAPGTRSDALDFTRRVREAERRRE
jgi:hypothetical protein